MIYNVYLGGYQIQGPFCMLISKTQNLPKTTCYVLYDFGDLYALMSFYMLYVVNCMFAIYLGEFENMLVRNLEVIDLCSLNSMNNDYEFNIDVEIMLLYKIVIELIMSYV